MGGLAGNMVGEYRSKNKIHALGTRDGFFQQQSTALWHQDQNITPDALHIAARFLGQRNHSRITR